MQIAGHAGMSPEVLRSSVVTQHRTRLVHSTEYRLASLFFYLIEVVVAQTVGKIQVRWISWNRISTSGRIKPYIHGVVREPRSCAVYNPSAQRETEKEAVEADPSFVGVNEALQ